MVQKSWVFRFAAGGGFHYVGRAQWAAWLGGQVPASASDTASPSFLEISLPGTSLELARWEFNATALALECIGRRQVAPDARLSPDRLLQLLQETAPAAAHADATDRCIDDYLQELLSEAGANGRRLHRVA